MDLTTAIAGKRTVSSLCDIIHGSDDNACSACCSWLAYMTMQRACPMATARKQHISPPWPQMTMPTSSTAAPLSAQQTAHAHVRAHTCSARSLSQPMAVTMSTGSPAASSTLTCACRRPPCISRSRALALASSRRERTAVRNSGSGASPRSSWEVMSCSICSSCPCNFPASGEDRDRLCWRLGAL